MSASKPLKRKDIVPGLKINHLGTTYEVIRVRYRKHATGRTPETVKVKNPETGFIGKYDVNLLLKHSKRMEG
ncbi:MAG: hypothetical protein C4542_02895 [Dehalococcoidia bacterium]|nr:MAG: hypothetical protein C4542_02895 [Dehalococcoidia bacterium]